MAETQDNHDRRGKKLQSKVFEIRKSPLTERFENNEDIRTIYNLFAIILISLLTNTIVYDYTKTGEFYFGFRLIALGFDKFHQLILVWCVLNCVAFLCYYIFTFWANTRLLLKPKTAKFWDKIWISIAIIYYSFWLVSLQKIILFLDFASGSSAVLFLEGIRILMKQHAFIRTTTPGVLLYKSHSDKLFKLPNFEKFLYFLFAPTLIYQDEYPRTETIRWSFVFYNFGEVFGIIWLLSLVVERFLVPPFEYICLRKYTMSEVIIPVMINSFPGVLFMLCGFYSVLHSFQNAFAEMLRFGDRMFYKEWWTSRSLSEYYRSWNVLVHDWLYTYIFKDMYEVIIPGNKLAGKLAVFIISAVIHEWILTNVLKLFLPIQFIQFFIAGAVLALLNILDLPVGNLVVWYLIVFGSGMQVNLYTLEIFARKNCPLKEENYLDFYKPRFIICNCIE